MKARKLLKRLDRIADNAQVLSSMISDIGGLPDCVYILAEEVAEGLNDLHESLRLDIAKKRKVRRANS